jgi:hypothetical protein
VLQKPVMASDLVSDGKHLRCTFLKAVLGLFGGVALLVIPPANASCQLENIPEEYCPLDLSEGAVNSLGNPVVGGPAASTLAAQKLDRINNQQSVFQSLGIGDTDETTTIIEGIGDAFLSGGNWTYDLFAAHERAFNYPVDPRFDSKKWLNDNASKLGIRDEYLGAIARTGSAEEAHALLADIDKRDAALDRLQRLPQPFRFFAHIAAAIPDVLIALFALGSLAVLLKAASRRTSSDGSEEFNASK